MNSIRKTKIVATIGPASRDQTKIEALLRAGVDVCRINCSHSNKESINADISRIRRTSAQIDHSVAILLDLQGPKIRTGHVAHPLILEAGDTLTIVMDSEFKAEKRRVGTTWPSMASDVKVGESVLFADGALSGTITGIRDSTPAEVDILIEDGGTLGSHKGINLPDTLIHAPALTEKDRADLIVGAQAGADFVALSFVRTAADVRELRDALTDLGQPFTPIIAKIEKPEAVKNIHEILETVDGIMVARGDLGVEIPLEQVPVVQKYLIKEANQAGVLVITATQMLDSMERNPRPTRAETTDVANAILDGTDAVMLSGETAAGDYPIRSVQVMDRIARQIEASPFLTPPPLDSLKLHGRTGVVTRAACFAARQEKCPMVVFTWSGRAAIQASKSRPLAPIYALSPHPTVCDRLRLVYGVIAIQVPDYHSTDELIASGEQLLIDRGLIDPGTEVVVLAGNTPLRGASNLMKLETVDGMST